MTSPFRILSIDGGGIMGAFAASALATFERATGRRVVEHFDLITGTSTGGIIAIGLAMGKSAEEICRFYEEEGATIFPGRVGVKKWFGRVRDLFRPRFSSEALRQTIKQAVGDQPLGEARTRLVIPSYDVNTGRVYLFKTPHHETYTYHADLPAVDAALATSAAPTYFPAHTINGLGTFIDGGLWANCPAIVGVIEALDFLGQAPERIRMLSLSTTSYPFRIGNPDRPRGLVGWAPKLLDTFMFGQAQSSVNASFCLLKRGLFHRIDPQVPPGWFRMDNPASTPELIALGRQYAQLNENMGVVKKSFLDGRPVEPFPPCYDGRGSDRASGTDPDASKND
jgi:patatin-like phospholipase/acyl hydrolase